MRSLARPVFAVSAVWPALAAAQTVSGAAATGRSAWNWVIGIAALVVVLFLARLIFGPGRAARGASGRGP